MGGGECDLPARGTEVMAGGKPAGQLGTVLGDEALAILRLDRIADALAAGQPVTAGEVPVTMTLPAWSGLSLPAVGGDAA